MLRVAARGGQATTYQRPLQLLYPLGISCSSDEDKQTEDKDFEKGCIEGMGAI